VKHRRHLLIVAHTPSPNTQSMADAVVRGISCADAAGVDWRLRRPLEAGPDDVNWADGLILGTTENFGYMSGAMKDFFDRIYYPCLESAASLPYALYIRAGNDGLGARTSIERIVTGLSWKPVQQALVCRGPWKNGFLDQCEELGMTLAAGLEAGIF
jgi:multimeric flavodoxin WrbA